MEVGWKKLRRPAVWWNRRGSPSGRLNKWWRLISFWMNTPPWNIGSPHLSVILHEMFLHMASQGQKEAEHMCHWGHQGSVREPSSEADQSTLHLIGFHMSWKELRDVYHSMYLLNRTPGFPSCGEVKRRRAIQEILSSLQDRLWRWTSLCWGQRCSWKWKRISSSTNIWGGPMGGLPEGCGDCHGPTKQLG